MMSSRIKTRRCGAAGIVAVALLTVAACGGGSDESSSGDGPRTVNIASATSSLSAGIPLAALSLQTFADHDLKPKYTDFAGSSPNTVAAVASGSADVGLVGAATGWDAMQEGAPLKLVAAIAGNTSELAMRTDVAERLGTTEEDPIEDRVAALEGLKIATAETGSANNQMLRSILTLYGMDPDQDVTIVPSEPTAIVAGLKNKAFDAAFYGIGVMQQNYADGSAMQLINLPRGDVPELSEIVFAFVLARSDTVAENPELIDDFINSLRDAGMAIKDDGDATKIAVKERWFPDLEDTVFDLSWDQVKPAWLLDCEITQSQLEASLDFQAETTGKTYDQVTFDDDVIPTAQG